MTDGGFRGHREAQRAHEVADDRRALGAFVRPIALPRRDALLELRGETARFDEAVAAGRSVHAVQLTAKPRDRLGRGGIRCELTR